MWQYVDYREAIGSLGIPGKEDVHNEMAMDAALDEMYQHFSDDLPSEWQELTDTELLEKWREYKKE